MHVYYKHLCLSSYVQDSFQSQMCFLCRQGIQEYINETHRKQAVREERLGKQPCLLLTGPICPLHLERHGKKDDGLIHQTVFLTLIILSLKDNLT